MSKQWKLSQTKIVYLPTCYILVHINQSNNKHELCDAKLCVVTIQKKKPKANKVITENILVG